MRIPRVAIDEVRRGAIIRHEGRSVAVDRVERSPDKYHWRLYIFGALRPVILPAGAVLTLARESSTGGAAVRMP